ncbi:hypothetical protein [Magnetospirillum fulvum]|jgi:hypothetical protein|uniref:Uncharacterized protein n=1 Tax=Magnetospirillum fulvum TaxID=1082 RepID=A0A1H6IPB3_MAGFU|nr:hypothetical protein [Magnetospirillum fulvum]SEH49321.1 hypothetical protein SAMN04244559_02610 [Magnetospirillum fulvum]
MLGPAELREIHEALALAGEDPAPNGRGPYLSAAFAAGMALTRALRSRAEAAPPPDQTPPPAQA